MGLAIEKAKKNGVGWVTAKGSNHFGICQWYTEMAMKQGKIVITVVK
jgi:L-2-hydroxycarboxylate dehydrogenase (NAD+)